MKIVCSEAPDEIRLRETIDAHRVTAQPGDARVGTTASTPEDHACGGATFEQLVEPNEKRAVVQHRVCPVALRGELRLESQVLAALAPRRPDVAERREMRAKHARTPTRRTGRQRVRGGSTKTARRRVKAELQEASSANLQRGHGTLKLGSGRRVVVILTGQNRCWWDAFLEQLSGIVQGDEGADKRQACESPKKARANQR